MKKKIVSLVLVFALALALGIGGTVAWLTAETTEVVNTFTVGDITIDLYETDATDSSKTTKANAYKIVPGGTDAKDPTIAVTAGSEKCYVYVSITNSVKLTDGTVVAEIGGFASEKWTKVAEQDDTVVYRYNEVVDASSAEKTIPVFDSVTYDGELITKANRGEVENDTIKVMAFAHQSENITEISTADHAAIAFFFAPANS